MLNLENIVVSLTVFFLIWMLIKNVNEIQTHSENRWHLVLFILVFPVLMFLVFLTIVLFPMFWIYRKMLGLILRIKLGQDFYGLVNNFDAQHSFEKTDRLLIHILMILECNQSVGDHLHETYKNWVHKYQMQNEKSVQKLFCTLENWMGYSYYKKIIVTIDDYVLKLPIDVKVKELNNSELTELLSECYYNPLPLNDRMLWDIQVGTQPIKCEITDKKRYPVLFRFHHVVGDGITLVQVLMHMFGVDDMNCFEIGADIAKRLSKQLPWYKELIQYIVLSLKMCILLPSLVYTSWILKGNDKNDFSGKQCIKKEILGFSSDKDGKYFQKVKAIKRKCFETSFADIVSTAFSASLRDCYRDHATSTPKYVTALIPVISNYRNLLHMSTNKVTLTNQYVGLQTKLPVDIDSHKDYITDYPLMSRLKIINKLFKSSKSPTEYLFKTTIFPGVGELLPISLMRFFFSHLHITMILSIMPGPPKFVFPEGHIELHNGAFWIPHSNNIGMNFTVFTYQNKLETAVNCNACLGLNKEAVSKLLSGTYKYLEILDKEIDEYREHEK